MHIPGAAREELDLPPCTDISSLQKALLQSFPQSPVFATTLLEELNRVFFTATKGWANREKLMWKKSGTAACGTLITGLGSPGVGKTPISIAATEVMGQPMKDMSALIRQLFKTLSPGVVQELKQHMAQGVVLPAFIVVCALVLETQANEDTGAMSINGAPRDRQQIAPIIDLFTKIDVVVRFAHLQTIMDRLQERAKHSTRKDDSFSVQQKRILEYVREGVLIDLIMLELADSRGMAILDNPGSAFQHFGGKSMEHIVQKATIIVEQTEKLSLKEATMFFAEIFFQSTSLQKRVQAQVGGVYTGEKKQGFPKKAGAYSPLFTGCQ